nr:uncharacterized protein DDB_G0283697 isoform X1 [Parasteatoda tepidariorum]
MSEKKTLFISLVYNSDTTLVWKYMFRFCDSFRRYYCLIAKIITGIKMQESGSFERCVVKVENIEDDSTPKILVSNFGNFGVLFLCQFCKNLMKQVLKCEYCKKELDCSMQELDSIAFEEVTLKQNRWLEYVQFMSSELPPSYDLQNETFNPQDLPKFCRVVNRIENEILKHCRTISNLYFNFERNEILSNSDTSIKMQESGSFERCVVKVENIEDDSTPKILIIRVFNDWNKFVSGFDCKKKALTAFIKEYITEDDFQEAIQLLCDDLIFTEELLQKYVCLSTLVKIQCEAQRKLAMEFLSDHKFFEYMKKYEWKANNLENCLKCYVDFDRYKSHDVVKKLKFLNKRFLELSSNVHNIQIKAEDIPPRKNFFKLASMQDLDEALREDVGEALRLQLHFSDEKMASDISGDEGEKSSTEEEESEEFSETEKNLVENQKISNNKDEVSSEMHELNTEEESEEFSETEENLVENQKISNNKDEVSSEMHELNTEEENEDFSETEENLVENQKISNNNDEDSYEMHELNTEEESEDFSETEENLVENQKISNNKDEVSSEMPELNTEEENKDFSETEENLVENQKISNNKNEVSYEMHELNTEEESEEFSETEENLVENQKISNYKDEVSYEMHELNMEEENEEFSETEENLVENQKISNNKDEVSSEMYELNMEENEEFSETEENLVENQKISDNKDEVSYEMHELNTEEESEEFSKTEENLVENQKISNNKDEVSYEMHELNTEEQSEEFSKTEENLVEKQKISNNKDEVSSEMHELNKGEESEEFSKTEENLFENQKISNNEDEVSYEMHELNTEEESKEFSKTEENLVEKQKISNNKDDLSCETHELNKGRESEEFSKLEENLVGNQKSSNNKDDLSCEMHGLNKEEESEEFSKTEENLIESQKISNKNDDVSYEMHELNKEEENEEFSETEENLIENQKFSNNTEDVTYEMPELNDVVEVSAENYEFYDEDEIKDNYDCPIEIKCSSVNFVFLKTFVQAENIIFTISSDGLTFPIQLENGSQTIYCKLTPSLVTAIESDVDEQPNKLVFTVNEEFFNDLKEKGFQSDDFDDSKAKEISFAIEEWPDILTKRLLIVFCQTDSFQDLESESINSDSSSRMSDVSPDINQSDSNDETGADLIFDQLINSDAKLSTDSSSSSSSDASSKMYFFPPSPKDNSKEEEDDFDLPEECISKLKDFAVQIGDEIQSDWLTEGKNMHLQFDNIISDNDSDEDYSIESDDLDEQRENEMQSDLLTEEENMDLQSKDNESSNDSIASPPQHNLIESSCKLN